MQTSDSPDYPGVPVLPIDGKEQYICSVEQPSAEAMALGLNTADPATLVIDLNCAFASIEQQRDPELRGRVLAIAAYATDAATIVSSSREARDLGVRTGMRVFEAKAIFPAIVIREPDPPLYRTGADKLIDIMLRHSPEVLRMSIDEASMNLAGTRGPRAPGAVPTASAPPPRAGGDACRGGAWMEHAAARVRGRRVRDRAAQELQPLARPCPGDLFPG